MRPTMCCASVIMACLLSGCVASRLPDQVSARRIIGPEGYNVNWDLPETNYYWLPAETEHETKIASDACNAPISVFVYHHVPRPPQFGYIGFRFEGVVDEVARTCLISRLKAVPALTIYPKRR